MVSQNPSASPKEVSDLIASAPSLEYRRTAVATVPELPRGLDSVAHSWVGRASRRASVTASFQREAARVQEAVDALANVGSDALRVRLRDWQRVFRRGETVTESAVGEALATVAEAARRQLGLRPHAVQLMAALGVHRGFLLEMATGEGKTLTVALAAVLAGWTGRPCHIITANDYLAARDAEWLRLFYEFCGLTAGCVGGAMKAPERQANYARDITYTTSKEAAADFLRDRLQVGVLANGTRRLIRGMLHRGAAVDGAVVMRGLHTAIIDEADSALVDEAVTPLIISRKQENEPLRRACESAYEIASGFEPASDYAIDAKLQEITLLPAGIEKLRVRAQALPAMWRGGERSLELVKQALRAREFFHNGKQYVVADEKIVIVDEYTGRLMHERTWRDGLHQAVEAKEGVPVTAPAETLARLSFQRFFRFYHKLAGLSGTLAESGRELWQIYRLPVMRIPTNRPCIRVQLPDRIFASAAEKWDAVAAEIVARHARRQPVLIGTRSVAESEHLAQMLEVRGLNFQLLNATRHKEEAAIVAEAGEQGRITIATNMAGRGTDIRLGPLVPAVGGLHVILTERHESRRIDRQLMGRAARQGDPGSAQAFVSLDDELFQRHAPRWLVQRLRPALARAVPGSERTARLLLDRAQGRAERAAFEMRRSVLAHDKWTADSLAFAGTDLAG